MSDTPKTDAFLAKNGAAGNQSKFAKFTRRLELENRRLAAALEHALGAAEGTDPGCPECKDARRLLGSL